MNKRIQPELIDVPEGAFKDREGIEGILGKIAGLPLQWFKKQPVLFIAAIATVITCVFVPVDKYYLGYFNWQTLATLFCTLLVVEAFSNIYVFEILSKKIVRKLQNLRKVTFALVFITFFGSMILANDMALLTFLPLGYYVLHSTDNKGAMAFTFIMQNIAANLGGMLTPFGNPQNLYIYAYYQMNWATFVKIMLPSFITAVLLIIAICCFVKPTPFTLKKEKAHSLDKKRTVLYAILFIASIMIVFRIVPYLPGTIIITLILWKLDKKALRNVNYPLLATFCVFFVFSGNLARIPQVHTLFSFLLQKNTLLFGILSCQCMSNVPSAILLSHFTNDVASLLPAVNIGGCGTLIASLASLITFSEFKKHNSKAVGKYMLKFTGFNLLFLIVLYMVQFYVSM